jgi:uncharacterized SAM-binding protein YcdF (DUF218 family)
MGRLARDLGVPASALIQEDSSRSTWENAEYSAALLHATGANRILIVTDRLHMRRAEACFARFGFATERASVPIYETSGGNSTMLYYGLRELLAGVVYRWRGHID